jgi:hypothetical protein
MSSSWIVGASDWRCQSRNSPGFNPSILLHNFIRGAADEAVFNTAKCEKKSNRNPPSTFLWFGYCLPSFTVSQSTSRVLLACETETKAENSRNLCYHNLALHLCLYQLMGLRKGRGGCWSWKVMILYVCARAELVSSVYTTFNWGVYINQPPLQWKEYTDYLSCTPPLISLYLKSISAI